MTVSVKRSDKSTEAHRSFDKPPAPKLKTIPAIAILTLTLSAVQIGIAVSQKQTDFKIAESTTQHQVMSEYLEEMTNLLIHRDGSAKEPDAQELLMASAMTLNASRRLTDPERKGQLLKFLYDAKLVGRCSLDPQRMEVGRCEDSRINLSGIKLVDAKLEQPVPSLAGINLSGASLNGSELTEITLIKANLREAKLEDAVLNGAVLDKADLQNTRLSNSKLKGARLQNALLQGAVLVNADLRGANLSNASLQNADLSNADLSNAMLQGAKYSKPGTQFSEGFDPAAHGMHLCNPEDQEKAECKL